LPKDAMPPKMSLFTEMICPDAATLVKLKNKKKKKKQRLAALAALNSN